MKPSVKILLDDLIHYHSFNYSYAHLQKAYDKIERFQVTSTVGYLLYWQKVIHHELHLILSDGIFTPHTLQITKNNRKAAWFKQLFEAVPELEALFSCTSSEIINNKNISEEEWVEIRTYIDDQYKIKRRSKLGITYW